MLVAEVFAESVRTAVCLATHAADKVQNVLWVVVADDIVDGFVSRDTPSTPVVVTMAAIAAAAAGRGYRSAAVGPQEVSAVRAIGADS